MKTGGRSETIRPLLVLAILIAVLAAGISLAYGGWRSFRRQRLIGCARPCGCQPKAAAETARLAPGTRGTIQIPEAFAKSLHLRTAAVGLPPIEKIRGTGQIFAHPQSIFKVHSPVAGVVIKIGQGGKDNLVIGSRVSSGQLLAEIAPSVTGKGQADNPPAAEIVKIVSPASGTILEWNYTRRDIVDPKSYMFKIARWDRMGVTADIYEDDIAVLERLQPEQRQWQVRLVPETTPGTFQGSFESFDYQFDPITGNGKVIGWMDDPKESVKIGQKVSVEIALPLATDLVAIPADALFHVGERNFVFVQASSLPRQFTLRQVEPLREAKGKYLVHSRPSNEQQAAGARPLLVNERVLDAGCLELLDVLHSLQKH